MIFIEKRYPMFLSWKLKIFYIEKWNKLDELLLKT